MQAYSGMPEPLVHSQLDSEEALLSAFRNGQVELASTAFVRRYQRFVMSVASRQLANRLDAEDVAQDVLMKALQSIHRFNGDSSITTWLYRITMNVIVSHRRRERLRLFFRVGEADGERDVVSQDPHPDVLAEQADFMTRLHHVLAKLPEKQRETFCLRYFDELSYEEMSQMLGTSVGGLKANYHLAVKKIAAQLRDNTIVDTHNWGEHHE
jgi:RNA polymerase sigma-70 factor (ECF subfamily)